MSGGHVVSYLSGIEGCARTMYLDAAEGDSKNSAEGLRHTIFFMITTREIKTVEVSPTLH